MKNILFPLIAVLLWSMNAIVNKAASEAIDPAAISFYRWAMALLVMTPFVIRSVWKNRQVIVQYWWKFAILGALGMMLYQSLAYYAAHSVSATFMGIMNSLIPLLTVVISIFVLRVIPTVGIALGTVLSLLGLSWLVSQGNPASLLQHGLGSGELMMLIASAAYALYGVLTKRWAIPVANWDSLYIQILFGVILLLPNFLLADDVSLNRHNIGLVAFAGIAASIIAPFLWIQGVIRLGANTTSIFMNLAPVFTAIIAVFALDEQLKSYHFIGGGVVLLGVMLAQQLRTPLTQIFSRKKIASERTGVSNK
ncbi:DMT family transporter [Moellerella wisconsensis]|uniref:Threonine/homoserine exporter RhtA n=2 Tax=Moellerella wisconsensis TaxID=158849 RepID=A0A9Q8PZI3_9GAMM|nr:DMT family transporter [Moellerella wisconsensis]UNH23209.1 DMT family transporter [Moellerella wisconsensis]UNH26285.1 DMT family transporter [Moellerella wisconsensis]UNH29700.1 DMT family transporter [Moellerella wisconsensis]UNH37896.1 DMT family transporter [Moellerella wisconsensis]UNH41393.1 DMT family transporter [Moellerella wisconsensis]